MSYAVAALDYTTSASPLKLGATATASPSSPSTSDAGDPLLPGDDLLLLSHPRAFLAPRGELLYLLPLSVSSPSIPSFFPARARTPRRGARRQRVSGDLMVTGSSPLHSPPRVDAPQPLRLLDSPP